MAVVPALTPLAKIVLALSVALVVIGIALHGLSFEEARRLWRDLFDRPGGPMSFRFVLQPVMASIAAAYDGIADARAKRTPYLRSLIHEPGARGRRLSEGIVSTARIILLGLGMDAIYQWKAFGTFYPTEAVLIALVLAFAPYVVMRGLIARIARWWMRAHPPTSQGSVR